MQMDLGEIIISAFTSKDPTNERPAGSIYGH